MTTKELNAILKTLGVKKFTLKQVGPFIASLPEWQKWVQLTKKSKKGR